ncbi:alpha/beta hydrolase fold domain-containing protein [Pseudonocardia sp. RS010]|uniref:alpha/beta hydrolase fold domain-containing protein n=1 Tax=Pseudonocardia sp. RS010 TaxID=3385979 RepID=UPI0039A2C0AF
MGRAGTTAGIMGVLTAAGARRPVLRRWPTSVAQMGLCTPASEMPLAGALGHAALAVGGVVGLVRGSRPGRATALATIGTNVAAVAALTGLRTDARRSAVVLQEALAPLGVTGLDRPVPGAARRIRDRMQGAGRYVVARDVAYGPEPEHRLDVWARRDLHLLRDGGPAPVLLQVHGGAWTLGSRTTEAVPLMAHLAARGWMCVTVDYRLAPAARWPAMIVDVKRALGWIREHVAGFGGDPGFVAVTGGSAGGHLAALTALTANDPAYQPGFEEVDTAVQAAVPLYGVHDFTVDDQGLWKLLEGKVIGTSYAEDEATYRAASPVHRAGPGAPPFLVVHGDTDTVAGVGQSRRLVARLQEVSGQPVCYAELPHAQHGFDGLPTARTAYTVRAVHRFLTAVHARATAPTA